MLVRLHSVSGVVLCAYLLVHLYEHWPALLGREAWIERSVHALSRPAAVLLVLLPLIAHALAGVLRFARGSQADDPRAAEGHGLTLIQVASAVVVAAFVVFHVVTLWSIGLGAHADRRALYAYLFRNLGRPDELAIYVVGIAAVCFHAGYGLSRMARGAGLADNPRAVLRVRVLAGLFGFALFVLFLQLLGHFALGVGLLG